MLSVGLALGSNTAFIPWILSGVSLLVSVWVAWVTLFRRGTLHMTQPVQVRFVYEHDTNANSKIFLRTLLYATGKRGYVIEGLYLKVKNSDSTQTFKFWGYDDPSAASVAGGLRITEEGADYSHHFLNINESSSFPEGNYEIAIYARAVNRKVPILLTTIALTLTEQESTELYMKRSGTFTWNPDSKAYQLSL